MNLLSPKIFYAEDKKRADRHQEVVLSPAFHMAAQIALAEYALQLAAKHEGRDALTSAKLEGVRDYLSILMNLGDVHAAPIDKSAVPELEPI